MISWLYKGTVRKAKATHENMYSPLQNRWCSTNNSGTLLRICLLLIKLQSCVIPETQRQPSHLFLLVGYCIVHVPLYSTSRPILYLDFTIIDCNDFVQQ